MPSGNTLTPSEAGKVALNSYFALKDWINTKPVAGVETRDNIENRVLGAASVGSDKARRHRRLVRHIRLERRAAARTQGIGRA